MCADAPLSCHVCEQENDFSCKNVQQCNQADKFCGIITIKIFPRFFMISKQCARWCPVIEEPSQARSKRFILEGPTPFLYVLCCRSNLCNEVGPAMDYTVFRQYTGRASEVSRGSARLATFLEFTATIGGLGLP
ncbi:lymphocyte antigen 6K [Lemur catta]|uniref:lymphocyte antigen 6K n=1 Tax=Lemur catta TaxID=9447 RepID=UPI001E268FAB|nr:lymphocyte antigen 6K [Lemur catta]